MLLPAIRADDGKPKYQRAQAVVLLRSGFRREDDDRAGAGLYGARRLCADGCSGPGWGERRGVTSSEPAAASCPQPLRYLARRRVQPRRGAARAGKPSRTCSRFTPRGAASGTRAGHPVRVDVYHEP